jgi:hypothetical protein
MWFDYVFLLYLLHRKLNRMKYIKQLARTIGLKKAYHLLQDLALRWRGFHLLTQKQTADFMVPYQISVIPENRVLLPAVINSANHKTIFQAKESATDQIYVWEYIDPNKKAWLSRYGSTIIRRKVLCTDRTHGSFYRNIWKKDQRPVKMVATLIAPFSHFQEGTGYGGYFDFVFFIAVKLCRIKDALPKDDFSDAVIAYPPFNSHYETEYLQLLGFSRDNLVDSSLFKVVSVRTLTGNGRNWHPNLADILSLKRHIQKKFQPVKTAANRVYISRACRRRIVNEKELIIMLKKFDFLIIDDTERTVTEQISIYHNASFILGPHGASFGNIIWCEPGTHLFELFSPNYMPDFFLYLTKVMDMKYSAYHEGDPDPNVNYIEGISEDIFVSVPQLELCLERILKNDLTKTDIS